jgi:uncharacterized protein (DUF1800 family)
MSLKKPPLLKYLSYAKTALLLLFIFSINSYAAGNSAQLYVDLVNEVDNTPLSNFTVSAFQRRADNSLKWFQDRTSDENGWITFNLQGLGSGTAYVLQTRQQYGNAWVKSDDINYSGDYSFNVRNVRVKVINGLNNRALVSHHVQAYKRNPNGKYTWFASAKTSSGGFADFYLPNLSSGRRYVFKSLSPVDNNVWYSSKEIVQNGLSTFVIGNKSLTATLINALDEKPIANSKVTAFQRLSDNSLKWFQEKTSDANGRVSFDLQGLGDGKKYVLITRPYGVKISSKNIDRVGNYTIEAGALRATLLRRNNGSLLTGKRLHLFERVASGKLEWRAWAMTNQQGVVNFDHEGLGHGKVYVIYGENLLGKNLDYYSQWISSKGHLQFNVGLDDLHQLDKTHPSFQSFLPQNNTVLSDSGFKLRMKVADNDAVQRVGIRIVDPVKGVTSGQAVWSNGEWTFSVTENMISKGQNITAEAEAEDRVGNKFKVANKYFIANDLEGPEVTVTSHRNGDPIDEKGFLLTGTVADNTKYVKMAAKIHDPVNGRTIYDKELEVGKNQHWALLAKDLPKGRNITVKLKAVDVAGNEVNTRIVLNVSADKPSMAQLINRITFGATPELLKELREQGAENFIQQQLHPERIDDYKVQQILNKVHANEPTSDDKLQNTQIVRAIYSKRQLLEVMTLFWESHFNTDMGKVNNARLEQLENNLFREHALGNFADLLNISATSPAMLIYLDNMDSYDDSPNENYARELMELHTLGVDSGYTSMDVSEVARAFTGWSVHYGDFKFHKWIHDESDKTVLGTYISANSGINGGEQVLDLLSRHDATARHICTKLLQFFVSDDASASDVNHCAEDFRQYKDEENQIALVLEGIFNSVAFSDSSNFHSKVKNPLEFVAGLVRQLSVSVNYYTTRKSLSGMGMRLFNAHLPTGWPEAGKDWVDSNQLTQRWLATSDAVFNTPTKWHNHIAKPSAFFIDQGIETTEGVLGYLFQIILAHDYSEQEWNAALSILTNNNSEKFDIYMPDADKKIRRSMALILQYPAYQLQ